VATCIRPKFQIGLGHGMKWLGMVPAFINGVKAHSGASQVVWVGHSQGTTQLMGSMAYWHPELQSSLSLFVGLAPVASVDHTPSQILDFMSRLEIAEIFALLGEKDFLPSNALIREIAGIFCFVNPISCENVLFLLCGQDRGDLNLTRMDVYMSHSPSGTSVYNMVHWSQSVLQPNGNASAYFFSAMTWGSAQANQQHYGQSTPPSYNLQNLHFPMALFSGGNDLLADPMDVQNYLIPNIPKSSILLWYYEPQYEHMDFVWGESAATNIYAKILQLPPFSTFAASNK